MEPTGQEVSKILNLSRDSDHSDFPKFSFEYKLYSD